MRSLTSLHDAPSDSARPLSDHLAIVDEPDPSVGPGEVLIRVIAAGINRADLAQSRGAYPPPPGAPTGLGLECAGTVAAVGLGVLGIDEGDPVCALVPGGGASELCLAEEGQVMSLPVGDLDPAKDPRYRPGFSSVGDESVIDTKVSRENGAYIMAATLVEAGATAWHTLVDVGGLAPDPWANAGKVVLVHGGTGSVGTIAIQLARALGARVLATAGSQERAVACVSVGAEAALDRHDDIVAFINRQTAGEGVDVIVDVSGAGLLEANVASLARGGRLIVIGLLGGTMGSVDLQRVLTHQLMIKGTTLRGQPLRVKSKLCADLETHVWPMVRRGLIRPVLGGVWDLEDAAAAHDAVLRSKGIGAHVLLV